MEAKKSRFSTWVVIIGMAILLPTGAVMALWEYMSATATPLHPDARAMKSKEASAPAAKWTTAVQKAQQAIRASVAERNLPGLSVAVGIGGDIVWAEGFGWADIDNQVAVTPKTRFGIGTASTALTSAAVGLLLEKGVLKLDEKIQTYVPEFPQKEWPLTVRQLMAHTAGMRTDSGDEGPLFSEHCDRPVDALKHFAEGSLRFEPGTQYRYSQYGWILLSAAVEAAAHEPFLAFMQKQVFAPLGMDDTLDDSDTEAVENRSASYFPRFAGDPKYGPDPMRELSLSCYSGASVFVSTASDLVRFGMAINGGKLLQPATVELLQKSQRLPSGQETGYGLGWDLETVVLGGRQVTAIGHDGDVLGGMAVSLMTFREPAIVVAVASNISYADTASIALKVAEAFTSPAR